MRLIKLEPKFIRYGLEIKTWNRVLGSPATYKDGDPTEEITGPREIRTFATADADGNYTVLIPFSEAQGIEFLCPKCFITNGGDIGTHWCEVTFTDRSVPDDMGSHNKEGKAVRWTVTGDNFENLTITPSILLEGGCNWHGFITNGEIK